MSLNRVILIGRLTRAPEQRRTQSGHEVSIFSLAVDRNFKNAAGERETDFINCVAWGKTSEFLNRYCGKGTQVAVEGALQMRKYEHNDETRTVYEVNVSNVQVLDKWQTEKKGGDGMSSAESGGSADGLPF